MQEYSKTARRNSSAYPRWLSSKQIPDEYLLTATELDESSEYFDFTNETGRVLHRNRTLYQVKFRFREIF